MLQNNGKPFHDYVDAKTGLIDRAIFSDQAIYELEMERIFARAWNFMCHQSQIPKVGDFFLSFIGEESVICTRDKTNTFQVFINSCRHRGNAVCRAESGNARSFLCTYHGWTYGLDGKLIGVPGYKDLYHEDLDREQWGLISAGKVQDYKGFIFANMDAEAVDLDEYLGEVGRLGLDLMAERGDMIAFEGVQKNQIGCNWKMAVDNLFDWYHVDISHASAMTTMFANPPPGDPDLPAMTPESQRRHRVMLGDYGHAISGPRLLDEDYAKLREHHAKMPNVIPYNDHGWRGRPDTAEVLGEVGRTTVGHPNIFPNLWVSSGGTQLSLRLPKGVGRCEIWWFTFREKGLPPPIERVRVHFAEAVFGPAGMLEQEDGENWDQSTRATAGVVARRYPLNFAMNLGHGEMKKVGSQSYIDTNVNEHAQLWTWRSWADWMTAANWGDLQRNHSRAPSNAV